MGLKGEGGIRMCPKGWRAMPFSHEKQDTGEDQDVQKDQVGRPQSALRGANEILIIVPEAAAGYVAPDSEEIQTIHTFESQQYTD